MTGRTVAPMRAIRLTYGLLLRQLVTRGRVVALLAVGAAVAAICAAVRTRGAPASRP